MYLAGDHTRQRSPRDCLGYREKVPRHGMRQKRELVSGIFFVVRMPSAWNLICRHFQDGRTSAITNGGPRKSLILSQKNGARPLGASTALTADRIRSLTYASPRGRVMNVGAMTIIEHGSDLERFMKISRSRRGRVRADGPNGLGNSTRSSNVRTLIRKQLRTLFQYPGDLESSSVVILSARRRSKRWSSSTHRGASTS